MAGPTPIAAQRSTRIAALVVLILAGSVLMVLQWISIRHEHVADAQAQAHVMAAGAAAAVMFDDSRAAHETLAPLAALSHVRRAHVTNQRGQIVASYPEASMPANQEHACRWDCIVVSAPIFFRDTKVGAIEMQLDMQRAYTRLASLAVTFIIASLAAYLLSLPLLRRMRERMRKAEDQLQYLAHYDVVTGLHNRNAFSTHLKDCRDRQQPLVLIQLDLDRFKDVNDKLGHHGGDQLLRQAGHRIARTLPDTARLFRLGGDEFAVVLTGPVATEEVVVLAEMILARFIQPFTVDGISLGLTASAGLSRWQNDADRLDTLAANADTAMYSAKREGRNRLVVFSPSLQAAQLTRISIRDALRLAIAKKQLALHFQPQVCAQSGQLQGAEALLRWTHPELGTVPPSTFIPIAEEGPLIIELGRWVIGEACRQIAAWHAQGSGYLRVAVNLSVRQTRDEALPSYIDEVLKTTGVPAHCLELEVTESVLMEDADAAVAQLARLRARGLRMAIDDFGTGYSSMSYLKRLPINKLKIDMAFVQDVPGEGEAIATAILAMAMSLGLTTVAEGVETPAQRDFFRNAGCQQLQGYLHGRAIPAEEFAAQWLAHFVARSDTQESMSAGVNS
ncbi:EAL domain-containing protein [Pseudoxanthomonas sp. PXM02]|uniref:putative bifunctional diguanylate cyclase/phosphodiesterase n=1 Tax=Pseudoxanthomonas sp. PXM02 TaxID=2769294 RepID=UPI001CE1821F|nr:EAL domain-containing protein [Pseudoxanthomonas sp. PXM02]